MAYNPNHMCVTFSYAATVNLFYHGIKYNTPNFLQKQLLSNTAIPFVIYMWQY